MIPLSEVKAGEAFEHAGAKFIKGFAPHASFPQVYCAGVEYAALKVTPIDHTAIKFEDFGAYGKNISSVGTDPEVFLMDGGKLLPAFEVLPPKSHNNSVFWDGFQAEVRPQAEVCLQIESINIAYKLKQLLEAVRAKHPKAQLSPATVVNVPYEVMKDLEPKYVELGCQGSNNAYGIAGEVPGDPRQLPWRFAGGHIHLGMKSMMQDALTNEAAINIVKGIDVVLGIPSVAMLERLDDVRRRRFYGLAGEFRMPKHGVEYRVLSNAWLQHPVFHHMAFMLARMGAMLGALGFRSRFNVTDDEVIECINNCDAKMARGLIERNRNLYKAAVFKAAYQQAAPAVTMWRAIMQGADAVVKLGAPIENNWVYRPGGYPMQALEAYTGNRADSVWNKA